MTLEVAPVLAHDYLLVLRGAERTFAAMADIWPQQPVFTLLYDEAGTQGRFSGHPIRASRLQRLGVRQRGFRRLLPLLGPAADRLGGGRHPLVVSSSSAFAHRMRTAEGGVHVCYCHTPFRYLWHERRRALEEVPDAVAPALGRMLDAMRRSDLRAAQRVTHFIANARVTQERIARYWERESTIVHPPVDVERFRTGTPEDWFLIVGELVSHKRTEVALSAAQRAGVRVKVVGTGPAEDRLKARFSGNAEFLGRVGDDELNRLYATARAFLMPNVEEFGIAAVEAQAAGRPVLAIDAGGARETVLDGVTGVLVDNADEFAEALRHVDFHGFDPAAVTKNAQRFSTAVFQDAIAREVAHARAQH